MNILWKSLIFTMHAYCKTKVHSRLVTKIHPIFDFCNVCLVFCRPFILEIKTEIRRIVDPLVLPKNCWLSYSNWYCIDHNPDYRKYITSMWRSHCESICFPCFYHFLRYPSFKRIHMIGFVIYFDSIHNYIDSDALKYLIIGNTPKNQDNFIFSNLYSIFNSRLQKVVMYHFNLCDPSVHRRNFCWNRILNKMNASCFFV